MKNRALEVFDSIGTDRIEMVDHEQFIDTQNGMKYHLYDEDFIITDVESNKRIASKKSFDLETQEVFQQMKYKLSRLVVEKETVAFEEAFVRTMEKTEDKT